MTDKFGNRRITLGLMLVLAACTPWIMGQGCTGGNGIVPITSGSLTDVLSADATSSTGNAPPTFSFTAPTNDISAEIGAVIHIAWTGSDSDSDDATVTLMLDPDDDYGNGNERVILSVAMLNTYSGTGSFDLDTASQSIPQGTYRIVARINDGVNPELLVPATGQLFLLGSGMLPGNVSPTIAVNEPIYNIGVSQGDLVTIEVCGRDPDDDGETPPTTPDIIVLLDLDDDPTNDLDLTGDDAESILIDLCQAGSYPVTIDGAYVLGCLKDNECGLTTSTPVLDDEGKPELDEDGNPMYITTVVDPTEFSFNMDVGRIPPREDGEPYRIRATMWDHVNLPASAYAPGMLSVTALGSGTIDLAQVGRTISGTRFYGFSKGDQAGYVGCDLGDFDSDGADDFVIVSRYGRAYDTANVGTAHVIFGLPPVVDASNKTTFQKFGSEIPLNSIGTVYRGALLTMFSPTGTYYKPQNAATHGICSVTRVEDVNSDKKPEILFGVPYYESWDDELDDDPQDKDGLCYNDLLPNPLSDSLPSCDRMWGYDWREGGAGGDEDTVICSNDYDLQRSTPIDGGYAIMVSSGNNIESGSLGLDDVGQSGESAKGARWRGAWYDRYDMTQTVEPYAISPDTLYGQTVRSMKKMSNTTLGVGARYGTELLISAPHGYNERGMIQFSFGQNWFSSQEGACLSNSFPYYVRLSDCCRALVTPIEYEIIGKTEGDHLGYAEAAGDFNLDGNQDIVAGAPGANRNGVQDVGVVYILFGRLDWYNIDMAEAIPPRVEIYGASAYDAIGAMQTIVGDINQDGVADIGFGSGAADGPGGVDSGFVGIVFGGRRLTGENVFTASQVGTSQLPGVKFYGTQPSGNAGAMIANVGDFNGDGIDDLIISADNETTTIDGQTRRGVAYLVFGGPHLYNKSFNLNQVGTSDLPGIIFVSPYADTTADMAPINFVGAAGDVNGDGFADVMLGVSVADFVNPLEPSQRRVNSGEMYLIYGSNVGTNTRNQ